MKPMLASVALILGVTFASAGSDLQTAADLWLQGNDSESLPRLARLAQAGNADARVLLSRIQTTDKGPSPYRQSLSKEESRTLFRLVDNNLTFARSWISVEAENGNELAQLLLRSHEPSPDPTVISRLNALGEHQASDYPTRIVALYGDVDMRESVAQSPDVLTELRPYLAYLTTEPEPRGDGLAALRHIAGEPGRHIDASDDDALGMAGFLALGFGFGDMTGDNRWRPVVEDWLMHSEHTKPIADLCRTECGLEAPSCAVAMMSLSGGYYEVIRLDSPLETLIPQDVFLSSPRARVMTLRRAALAKTETNIAHPTDQIAEISECAANMIATERSAYN